MSPGEFITPTEDEILDAIGVVPETQPGDDLVRVISFGLPNGHDKIRLSYHLVAGSIDFQWLHDDEEVARLTRECAVLLRITSGKGEAWVHSRFDGGSLGGELEIRIYPTVRIEDSLLRH